jgi:hypothetical protein
VYVWWHILCCCLYLGESLSFIRMGFQGYTFDWGGLCSEEVCASLDRIVCTRFAQRRSYCTQWMEEDQSRKSSRQKIEAAVYALSKHNETAQNES